MATIQTALRMFDGFSNPLQKVITAMESTLGVMDELSHAVDQPNRVAEAFNVARKDISLAQMEIENSTQEMQQFNNQVDNSGKKFDNLVNKAKQLFGVYAMIQGGKHFLSGADEFAGSQARLNLINDKLQTVDELNEKIFQSAQRARSGYASTLDIVGKLGVTAKNAFETNDQIIYFTELMAKSFKIAGASATEQKSAMYQLTQAMAAGRLQGDEFRSINENAPLLAQSIADVMGVTRGELKTLSADGVITADIIKTAIFTSADDINAKFEQIPMKFSDVVTNVTNMLNHTLRPSFQKFINWLNSDTGQMFFLGIASAMIVAFNVAGFFINALLVIVSIFTDHWSLIAPIIFMVIWALILLNAEFIVTKASTIASAIWTGILAAKNFLLNSSLAALTAAQSLFNGTLMACPLSWILLLIVLIIGSIWLFIKVLNHFGITTGEIIGAVVGVFYGFMTYVQNVFIGIRNYIGAFTNFFENVFIDPVGAVKMLFLDLSSNVIKFISKIAEALEKVVNLIPGVEVNMTNGLNNMLNMINDAKEAIENETGVKSFEPIEFKSITEAYGKGFEVGENAWDNISSKFSSLLPKMPDMADLEPPFDVETPDFGGFDVDSVGSIEDEVDISEEDIELLRDLASMEAVNQYATLAPNIKVEFGDVRETADVDKVAKRIGEILEEQIAVSTDIAYG